MRKDLPRGFTLVEMLVSLAIFAVITAFATANFNSARQGDEVRIAAQLVAGSIRRMQSAAASGETVRYCVSGAAAGRTCTGAAADCPGGSCVNELPAGYGMRFTTGTRVATVFADLDGDRAYDDGEAIRAESLSPGNFVAVTSLAPDDSGSLTVVFEPPKPNAYLNGSDAAGSAVITVGHAVTGTVRTIRFNRISGQVSID